MPSYTARAQPWSCMRLSRSPMLAASKTPMSFRIHAVRFLSGPVEPLFSLFKRLFVLGCGKVSWKRWVPPRMCRSHLPMSRSPVGPNRVMLLFVLTPRINFAVLNYHSRPNAIWKRIWIVGLTCSFQRVFLLRLLLQRAFLGGEWIRELETHLRGEVMEEGLQPRLSFSCTLLPVQQSLFLG